MTSPPLLSLCIPICDGSVPLKDCVDNITSFFQKFPLTYEVLIACVGKPSADPDLSLPANFKVIPYRSPRTRAKNLEFLFAQAQGDLLFALNLDLSIPLSECFKVLEVFLSNADVEAVFGDRTKKKKKKLEDTRYTTELEGLEKIFSGILHEKTQWPFLDPFCPVFALRRSGFQKIEPEVRAFGWHLTPEIQRLCQKHGLQSQEIPLYSGSRQPLKPPFVSEALGLLRFVLFRV